MNSNYLCSVTFLEVYFVPKLVEQLRDECGADGRGAAHHCVGLLQELGFHQVTAGQEVQDGRHGVEVGDLWGPGREGELGRCE